MATTPDSVINFLVNDVGRPVKVRELAHLMALPEREYPKFRAMVKEMLKSGRLVTLKRGRIAPPDPVNLVVGTVFVRRGQHFFLRIDPPEDDPSAPRQEIFIRSRDRMTALDGDRVMVRRHSEKDGPTEEGAIIKILERALKPIVGIYHKAKHFCYVVPDPPHPLREVYVPANATKKAQVGQQVVVQITDWDSPDATPSGKIIDVLGFPDEPGVDIERVIGAYNLPRKFPAEVLQEAKAYPEKLTAEDLKGRTDFRDKITFTIDPFDAKDHDDAVSIERIGDHWLLEVHIADVSHYVSEGHALDREAYERSTSVYLVDRVIPMLPERLSNDLCSLRPDVDRLTLSCVMEVADSGEVTSYHFTNGVIRSRAKLSYEMVMDYFATGEKSTTTAPLASTLDEMRKLARIFRARRFKIGSLDLDVPEAKVVLDEAGHPVEIRLRHSDESHQLVEEFMLAANQCAAHIFLRKNLPCLYRVHAPPSPEKMEEFAGFAETLGFRFAVDGGVTPKKVSQFLDQIRDDPRKDMIHQMLLRSLMKAVYQPDNIGHFGLAFPHYTHFTSPIRRYPDLWIHRHIKKIEANSWTVPQQHKMRTALPAVGRQTSDRERQAEEAERESVRIKQLEYLSSHLGDEFSGKISGFLEFGMFVSLDDIGADGLVRFSGIDDDFYVWDRDRFQIRGRRLGKTFKLGEAVRVRLTRTDAERREIDLEMVGTDVPPRGKTPANRHGRLKKARKRH